MMVRAVMTESAETVFGTLGVLIRPAGLCDPELTIMLPSWQPAFGNSKLNSTEPVSRLEFYFMYLNIKR